MNRFFGLMPSEEIEKEVCFEEQDGSSVTIQAGSHGWTIVWCDQSTTFEDVDGTTEENFQKALKVANKEAPHGPLKEVYSSRQRLVEIN